MIKPYTRSRLKNPGEKRDEEQQGAGDLKGVERLGKIEEGPLKDSIMDMLKFFDITHREHVICNPTSEAKLARLVGLLRLPADAQVVDIACGKGEFLIRLAETYGIRGTGIDISPFYIAEAEKRLETRAPAGTSLSPR